MWIMFDQNYDFVFLKNHMGTIINWIVMFFPFLCTVKCTRFQCSKLDAN